MSDDVKAKRAPARKPEQKAQDAVDAAQKRLDRAKDGAVRAGKAWIDAGHAKELAQGEEAAAKAALEYARANPDLPKKFVTADPPITSSGTPALSPRATS